MVNRIPDIELFATAVKRVVILTFISFVALQGLVAQRERAPGVVSGLSAGEPVVIDGGVIAQGIREVTGSASEALTFAIPVKTDINPSNAGVMHLNSDGSKTWVVSVRSPGAHSLNLIFEPYNLSKGSSVTIYTPGGGFIRGAFTEENNSSAGIVPTAPLPGDEVIVEYRVARGASPDGSLAIAQVAHDFVGLYESEVAKSSLFGRSQPCNVDVSCNDDDSVSANARSVVRIIVSGFRLCSGVMVNSTGTAGSLKPLLITANHCISNSQQAESSLFLFNYDSPFCDGPGGLTSHTIAGSNLLLSYADLDHTMVELSEFPPIVYSPYLAGWDVTGSPPASGYTIHHPAGDVKKLTIDNSAPVTSSFLNYKPGAFWNVLQWSQGATEGGSSGAPLFSDEGLVTGSLSGGESVCGRAYNDYFSKLYATYLISGYGEGTLMGYLDPMGYGFRKLGGRDPYSHNMSISDTIRGYTLPQTLSVTPLQSPQTGYTTGFSSDSITGYAVRIENSDTMQLLAINITPSVIGSSDINDSVTFVLMSGDDQPGESLATKKIPLNWFREGESVAVDFNRSVAISGSFYAGWYIKYRDDVPAHSRQLAVAHTENLIDESLNSAWFFRDDEWMPFMVHPSMPGAYSLAISAVVTGSGQPTLAGEIAVTDPRLNLYPVPVGDLLYAESPYLSGRVNITIYDIGGRRMMSKTIYNSGSVPVSLPVADLAPGIYILSAESGAHLLHGKFIKR